MHKLDALAAAALACALALPAAAMTREQYHAQRMRIQDKYATDKDRCSTLQAGHPRDVCEAQAHADYSMARAQLRAEYKPSAKAAEKARRARIDATYDVARAKCGDLSGSAKRLCLDEARKSWTAAKAEPASS